MNTKLQLHNVNTKFQRNKKLAFPPQNERQNSQPMFNYNTREQHWSNITVFREDMEGENIANIAEEVNYQLSKKIQTIYQNE